MHDSDYVMTCTTAITPVSSKIKKLLLEYNLHSSYNQIKYMGEEKVIHNIFSTYVEPLLNCINHPALVKKWNLNINAPVYEKKRC